MGTRGQHCAEDHHFQGLQAEGFLGCLSFRGFQESCRVHQMVPALWFGAELQTSSSPFDKKRTGSRMGSHKEPRVSGSGSMEIPGGHKLSPCCLVLLKGAKKLKETSRTKLVLESSCTRTMDTNHDVMMASCCGSPVCAKVLTNYCRFISV